MSAPDRPTYATTETRWRAVCDRDASADGAFYYAVRTTGIFCRPSCPSRVPKAGHVEFFDTPEAATRAGFRACKRCNPAGAAREARVTAIATRACRAIESETPAPALEILARRAAMSPFHFQRLFKEAVGVTPKQYELAVRRRRLAAGLADGATLTRASLDAGYPSLAEAQREAPLGMPAAAARRKGEAIDIRYAVAPTTLGAVLVAMTERGVCAIEFGGNPRELVAVLAARFSAATLIPADAALQSVIRAVVAYVESPAGALDLPLDIRGTAFEQRVWQAIRTVPAGETISYADLADRIGRPGAARAVAHACGANRIALAVPCHRVIASSGDISGYRWGEDRKRALLVREHGARATHAVPVPPPVQPDLLAEGPVAEPVGE